MGLGALGTILGLINQFWGSAILARREKVIIREPEVAASVVSKFEGKPLPSGIDRIFVRSSFKIVRTRGEEDLYLESAYLQLSKALCEQLNPYFRIPASSCVYWSPSHTIDFDEAENRRLEINKSRGFSIYGAFESRYAVQALWEELRQARTDEEHKEKLSKLNSLEEKVERLKKKYEIIWIDGKGKKWRYRLPERWWNKFLPERLWWNIA